MRKILEECLNRYLMKHAVWGMTREVCYIDINCDTTQVPVRWHKLVKTKHNVGV